MSKIYRIHSDKLPGYRLGCIYDYFSFEVSCEIRCSIILEKNGTYTFYYADLITSSYGRHYRGIDQAIIEKTSVGNGADLLCWLCHNNKIIGEEFVQKLYSSLIEFDPSFANEFKQGYIRCETCDVD